MRIFLVPPTNDHRWIDCPPYHSPTSHIRPKTTNKAIKSIIFAPIQMEVKGGGKNQMAREIRKYHCNRHNLRNDSVPGENTNRTNYVQGPTVRLHHSTWPQYPAPAAPFFNTLETTPTGGGYNQSAIFGSPFCVYGILAEKLLLLSINGCWQI